MASPLSPAQDAALNLSTPTTARRYDKYEVEALTLQSETLDEASNGSSPFVSSVNETAGPDQENFSPSKSRHSRVMSGTELSPLKMLVDKRVSTVSRSSPDKLAQSLRSPRKLSHEKRFPVKPSNPIETPRASPQREMSLDDALTENEGLKRAIAIFEDEHSVMVDVDDEDHDVSSATINVDSAAQMDLDPDESSYPDDTMASTFSTFSAVPNMTMFAKLGQSPAKVSMAGGLTPRGPRPDPSPSRTPRPASVYETGNTTNLLDFTEQMRFPHKASSQRNTYSPSRTAPNVTTTPARQLANLIDFDIPPMPTPRSVPSITPRELESLKSNFLSEISSLKASLSGKEAEVQSLKTAVGDAEKRVGESLEQLREERSSKEQLVSEKEGWENRGREMENVLRNVKEEIVRTQREQEEMEQKLEESEKRREAAEMMHQEAESKMAGMRAGKDLDKSSPSRVRSPSGSSSSNQEVEIAVERVARELHALYKSKHETKVAALKKSYESRWEKKVRELEFRIDELADENDRLRQGRDATMTRVDPGSAEAEERKAQAVRDSAAITELNADIQRLEAVVQTVQQDNVDLRGMLEKERVEKGELVQLAEEMMNMQSVVGPSQAKPEKPEAKTPKKNLESLRGSMIRSSGLRAPTSGLRQPHERTKSAGLPRPGGIGRSGIMNSIEKMGSYRGRVME